MPSRGQPMERLSRNLGQWMRRARVQSGRLKELLRASQSAEGRRRYVLPLMLVCGAAGCVLGLALGWHRQRRH